MKLSKLFYFFLFAFIAAGKPSIIAQDDREIIDQKSGSIAQEEAYNIADSISPAENIVGVKSSLSQKITISLFNVSLEEVLKHISDSLKVNFAYGDQIIKIKNLNLSVNNEPLHTVLDKMLEPYDISYFEYETGKIALAKSTKVDERTGGVKGIIKDENNEILIGVNVMLKEIRIGCASDLKGNYSIRNIKPGEYTLEVSCVGYEKLTQKIRIREGQILEINISLKSTAFQIGGIEVIGTSDLLPSDVTTKTTITSGEIEHFQAASIKDVLDLVPGIQKSDNPGLGKTTQVAVRGDESDALSAFGTLIIIDGTPVSNNANLQFESLTGAKFGSSSLGRGIDLRTIPADNIENLEVITGLPSVKYGDVTSGVINVQSKIGPTPNRFKFKNNPDTREGNFGGGIVLGEGSLSYNLNAAQSERDIRVAGDEYLRLTGQLVYSANYFENRLSNNTKVLFQRILDEEEPKGDLQQIKNYNRGYTFTLSTWGKYKPEDEVSAIDYNLFVTMRRENTMKSRLKTEYVALPSGDTIASYIGKVETKGIEWTLGGRLEWNKIFYTGDIIHKVLFGIDPQYNANTGQGVMFDTLLNYYGVESGKRPYSFDDIPGQLLTSIYFEDKLTWHSIFDFNLMFGFRYEMYRPYKFNLSGLWGDGDLVESHQGTFFNPRINLMVYLSDANQIRLSAGTSSKSPPMSIIYPPEDVFLWRNPDDGSKSYLRYDRRVPELKGYRETMFEIAYDHKFMNLFGVSASAYYKFRKNEPKSQSVRVFVLSQTGTSDKLYYIDEFSLPVNIGKTETKGIEFSFKTAKIKPLNMDFQITGSYNYIKYPGTGMSYSSTPSNDKGQTANYRITIGGVDTLIGFIYNPGHRWNDRFQINYYVKYTLAPLGLWITLRAEQLVWEKNQSLNQSPIFLDKATQGAIESYYFEREIKRKPQKWLFNISMSKSLFEGAEVSFYVNNFIDDPALYRYYSSIDYETETTRNPSLFYGLEFSMIIDKLLGIGGKNEED
ncbi:MAG: TonB-dependent receptor [Ignavibacteriaceae bacterium]|nr:TonB-dependent receptor [Ignavibacteriaceae bacterium]